MSRVKTCRLIRFRSPTLDLGVNIRPKDAFCCGDVIVVFVFRSWIACLIRLLNTLTVLTVQCRRRVQFIPMLCKLNQTSLEKAG